MLFTTKPSVIVFRPTWKVNVKRMVLTSSRKWDQPPAVVCSACCRCSLKSASHFVTQCNKLLQPHHKLWATPHNSKCQYGERGAAAAKPKAQAILCVLASILATQMLCRTPSRSEALRSATAACGGSWRGDPPERCLSRQAGIVRCCRKKEKKRPPFGSRFWVMQFVFGFSRRGR